MRFQWSILIPRASAAAAERPDHAVGNHSRRNGDTAVCLLLGGGGCLPSARAASRPPMILARSFTKQCGSACAVDALTLEVRAAR
jgi:hypothetical protein